MTTPVYPAGATPYCTIPELLSRQHTFQASAGARFRPGRDVNTRSADSRADQYPRPRDGQGCLGYVNQVLRATIDWEQVTSHDYRVTVQNGTGNGRIILSRWPVLSILSVQVAPNAVFPEAVDLAAGGRLGYRSPPFCPCITRLRLLRPSTAARRSSSLPAG